MKLNYDVINLNFDGGLGYSNGQGEVKRTTAIKKNFLNGRPVIVSFYFLPSIFEILLAQKLTLT